MMYSDQQQQQQQQHQQQLQQQPPQIHQQQQQPQYPPPPQMQHPQQQQQQYPLPPQMMQHPQQLQQQHQGYDFHRGPPPPPMRQGSASSTNINPDYHHQQQQPQGPPPGPYDAHGDAFAAKRVRKVHRKAVDYTSTVVRYMQVRMWQRDSRDRTVLQPIPAAAIDLLPTVAYADNPSTSFAAKFVHASTNKNRCPINRVLWTPTGRRLITGSQSGEFTLWNGQSFNFEMIIQAHDQPIRSMIWSHNENWMVSGDDGGSIKYWQNNMNNVKANKSAHKESVRDLSFSRTDLKFCSCSDDTTVKVWDFARCQEESSLSGHGWDVKSVDWHPTKSLLVSGGKDNLVKLWDAKSGKELCSFHGHKNIVQSVKWNQNGNWILTASKDQVIKLYDIRSMKELQSFRGHQKDVTALSWHPFHEEYFVSGSHDGSINHWIVGHEAPLVEVPGAHENMVCDLAWHPVGYILCSGSNDHTTRFWCRNRPGDPARTNITTGYNQGYADQNQGYGNRAPGNFPMAEAPPTPGPFSSGLPRNEGSIPGIGPLSVPGLDSSDPGEQKPALLAPPLPPGPHPSQLTYQQMPTHQQHQPFPQHMGLPPQLPPPSHMPFFRPPSQMGIMPQTMQGSMPMPSSMTTSMPLQMPGPMGMQGQLMGVNPMQPPPTSGFATGQAQQSGSGLQMYPPPGGGFNRQQPGQYPMGPGIPYQTGSSSGMGMSLLGPNVGHPSNLPPPPPLPPHGSMPQ
ncbi:hypothetical protein ACHQM5_012718 [Ranunculus cassubicifolius]